MARYVGNGLLVVLLSHCFGSVIASAIRQKINKLYNALSCSVADFPSIGINLSLPLKKQQDIKRIGILGNNQ